MLKLSAHSFLTFFAKQPPSGGCVLKHEFHRVPRDVYSAAAFRRLCVETQLRQSMIIAPTAAAFRRLCVETFLLAFYFVQVGQPPSGGCVLKPTKRGGFV